jgi:DNA modification methylase
MQVNLKKKAPYNRTITLKTGEVESYKKKLIKINSSISINEIENKIINQDIFEAAEYLPDSFVDLLFIDPPYNIDKKFSTIAFKSMEISKYEEWIDSWLGKIIRFLKPSASIYICGDWKSSTAIYNSAKKYFKIQNRITWEREKGRGAKANWKNCSEDIWFCTMSNNYKFNVEDVKLKRKVIAPYRTNSGQPKDWDDHENGNYRTTYPSNIWMDITIPFWSMPENTDHPTQKPEKLLAKIILASSNKGDFIFDPFLGSGTTAVTAKKLGRRYSGIEKDEYFCCIAEKRLAEAEKDKTIQGFHDGVFWERNTFSEQKKIK